MNRLILLDVPLLVLGLLALSLRLFGSGRRPPVVLAFYLGLAMIATAGADVGLVAWEQAHRPKRLEESVAFERYLAARRAIEARAANKAERLVDAPDFCLPSLDEGRSIRLSDFRGHKPVVLIFGSFG